MIELCNVTAGYPAHEVLSNISASFEKGQLTSIIGLNGSGKSTLLKVLLHLLPPARGNVSIDGMEPGNMSRKAIARKAAYLTQEKNTPDMTVEQMVLHGRFPYLEYPRHYTAQDREIVLSAMEQVGIADLAHRPLHTLSGGMRQNAYIAMALAQSTDYILLDEPTTFLDIPHQLALMSTLRNLAGSGKGILTVMHDLPMAFTFSDRILLLHAGRILCYDTPANVCSSGLLKEVFGIDLLPDQDLQSYHYRYKLP